MTTSRLALVVIAVGLLCAGNAAGQNENKAESDAAVVVFEATLAAAKGGHADAMVYLGVMYAYGIGV